MKRPADSALCTRQRLGSDLLFMIIQSCRLTSLSPEPTCCSSQIEQHKHIDEEAHYKLMTNWKKKPLNKITDMTLTFGLSKHGGLKRHHSSWSQKVPKPSIFWKVQIYCLGSSTECVRTDSF